MNHRWRATAPRRWLIASLALTTLGLSSPLAAQSESENPLKLLNSDDPEVRLSGAKQLCARPDPSATAALVKALSDPDPNITSAAAAALNRLKEHPAEAAMIRALIDHPHVDVRRAAAHRFYLFPTPLAMAALGKAANSDDAEVRMRVAQALGRTKEAPRATILARLLEDPDAKVRLQAAEALRLIPDALALSALAKALSDEDARVRMSAAQSLARLEGEDAAKAMLAVLNSHADSEVRNQAAYRFLWFPSAEATSELARAMNDKDHQVRRSAAAALRRLPDATAIAALSAALDDEDATVRLTAAQALNGLKDQAAQDALLRVLNTHADYTIRNQAATRFFFHPSEKAIGPLTEALNDPSATVRLSAARSLQKLPHIDAISTLTRALYDANPGVCVTAANALAQIDDPAAEDALLGALNKHDDAQVRLQAATRFRFKPSKRATTQLAGGLTDTQVEVRRAVAQALALMPHPAVAGPLQLALQDEDAAVRLGAVQALAKIADPRTADSISAVLEDSDENVQRAAAAALKAIDASRLDDDERVLDDASAMRWIKRAPIKDFELPESFVEFVGGDRLPGVVDGFHAAHESEVGPPTPAHLELSRCRGIRWPAGSLAGAVRVRTRWVRRVVWQNVTDDVYTPSTVYLRRGGQQLSVRGVDWKEKSVRVLTDEGIRDIEMDDIAELHLPQVDCWQSWMDQLRILSPDGRQRLLCFVASSGLRVTCSTGRFWAFNDVSGADAREWTHLIHPAWSLDPLPANGLSLHLECEFSPRELPLTYIQPSNIAQSSPLAGIDRWRRDRNAQGDRLQSADLNARFGFGVHADCRLSFPLSPIVRSVRLRVGLDNSVHDRGCARALVRLQGAKDEVVYASPLLIGSAQTHDSQAVNLPASTEGRRTLVLIADSAHAQRPVGADPLNIGDRVNWLEPMLELDLTSARNQEEFPALGAGVDEVLTYERPVDTTAKQ